MFLLNPWELVLKCVKEGAYLHTLYIPMNMRKTKPLLPKSKDNNVKTCILNDNKVNDLYLNCKNVNDLYLKSKKVNEFY